MSNTQINKKNELNFISIFPFNTNDNKEIEKYSKHLSSIFIKNIVDKITNTILNDT